MPPGRPQLEAIVAAPAWKGEQANGVGFIQIFDRSGGIAYGRQTSLLIGRIEIHGDQLHQVIEGYLLNRPS